MQNKRTCDVSKVLMTNTKIMTPAGVILEPNSAVSVINELMPPDKFFSLIAMKKRSNVSCLKLFKCLVQFY